MFIASEPRTQFSFLLFSFFVALSTLLSLFFCPFPSSVILSLHLCLCGFPLWFLFLSLPPPLLVLLHHHCETILSPKRWVGGGLITLPGWFKWSVLKCIMTVERLTCGSRTRIFIIWHVVVWPAGPNQKTAEQLSLSSSVCLSYTVFKEKTFVSSSLTVWASHARGFLLFIHVVFMWFVLHFGVGKKKKRTIKAFMYVWPQRITRYTKRKIFSSPFSTNV